MIIQRDTINGTFKNIYTAEKGAYTPFSSEEQLVRFDRVINLHGKRPEAIAEFRMKKVYHKEKINKTKYKEIK
jgi:hypothetical protein